MENETLRMQMLSGVITESEYKTKLEEAEAAQAVTAAEKIEDKVETSPSIEAAIDKLSDEEKAELTAALAKLGITADSSVESAAAKIAPKIEKVITEADEDLKKKVTKIASGLGIMLTVQNAIPLLSLVIGHAINPSSPLLTGVGLTFGVGGALIGLAKALDGKKVKESLNEHYVAGGIVGIGAINQIPPRAKTDYEMAFEHFLGGKYGLNEVEKVNENMYYHVLEDGGYGNIGYRGVYDTQEKAQNRADELTDMFPNSEFYVEASDSEDEPYSVTSSDYDPDMDFNEGKEVEEPYNY